MPHRTRFSPPANRDFREMFCFIVDHGIGRPPARDGQSEAWTDEALEAAFAETATPVDKRSIQSWRSGASVPRLDKVRTLASLVAPTRDQRDEWRRALIDARRRSLDARKQLATGAPSDAETIIAAQAAQASRRWTYAGVATAALVLFAAGFIYLGGAQDAESRVANIEFCAKEDFSTETYRCLRTTDTFDPSVTTLMVTFDLVNVERGTSFERIWYREGLEFLRKSSFNDDAWPGYTFLNFDRFPEGNYTLRIVVDGKSYSAPFKVGEKTGYLAYQ